MSAAVRPSAARRSALIVVAGVLALTACTADEAPDGNTVTVSRGSCGADWSRPHGGEQTIQVHNTGTVTTEVDLVDPGTGGIYAEVEALAPQSTRPMHVTIGRGTYAFRCLPDETSALTGPTVRVTDGPEHGAVAVAPVDEQDLRGSVEAYRAYVGAGLTTLARDVGKLRTAIGSGRVANARAAWLTAHLAYERLGAAYDTFGDYADRINGMPDGLPGGVRDPDFAGFRRIEYGLWHGERLSSLVKPVNDLAAAVAGLRGEFSRQQTDPNDLPLRAHEILENTLQFELTGQSDQGSGTSLATIAANLDGTQAVLDTLAPVMRTRYAEWDQVTSWMARTRQALAAAHGPGGRTVPIEQVSDDARRRLDGAVGQLLESLAPIAAIGDVRRTS